MQVLTPGHKYIAANFENPENGQTIQFIEKKTNVELRLEGSFLPKDGNLDELYTVNDGTTNEELAGILIDRLNFLNGKFPCRENALAITNFEQGLMWLNQRTANRVARGVEGTHQK